MLLRPASMPWLKTCYLVVILALVASAFAPQVLPVQARPVAAPSILNWTVPLGELPVTVAVKVSESP